MDLPVLFNCFIVGGFVIPVLNVVVGAVTGGMDLGTDADVDLDVDADFDVDIDADVDLDVDVDADLDLDTDVDLDADLDVDADLDLSADAASDVPAVPKAHGKLPVNLMTLSLSAVIFGAVGRLLLGKLPDLWAVILALQAGVLGGFLLGWFVIRPLKQNRAYAANIRALRGRTATVQLELRDDFTGTIEVLSATGTLVSYSAKPVEGVSKIAKGQLVSIVDVDPDKSVCTVRPLENKTMEQGR